MSEFITIQVGQCGNQIGSAFWPLVLQEHGMLSSDENYKCSTKKLYDDALHSFFHIPNNKTCQNLSDIKSYNVKARALLIDMEESVVDRFKNGKLNFMFDKACSLTNYPGSGNNWAIGHYVHGSEQKSKLEEMLRSAVEKCDNLHGFQMLFSLGGGTGSGLGTAVLSMLDEYYCKIDRLVTCVHPGIHNDVITSPYNIAFSFSKLLEHATCVFPVDNQALLCICDRIKASRKMESYPFRNINSIIVKMLLHLTSGARFPGTMNLDINEISTNMVPYPGLQFLSSSINPIEAMKEKDVALIKKESDLFYGVCTKDNQLLRIDPMRGTLFGVTLSSRGKTSLTTLRSYVEQLKRKTMFPSWAKSGVKVAHCSTPPSDNTESLLLLTNTTAMASLFDETVHHFDKLYKRKAHVHHYLKISGFDEHDFINCKESLLRTKEQYLSRCKEINIPRFQVM